MGCPWEHAHVRSCRLAHQHVCPTGSADFLEAYLAGYVCLHSCLKTLLTSELAMQNRLKYIARRCLGNACWVLQLVEDCLWLHLHRTDVEFYWRTPGVNTTATLCLKGHVDDVAVCCWTIWTEDHQRRLQQLYFDQVKGLCNDTSRKLDCTMLCIATAHDSHSDRKCNSSNSQRMVASQFHCDVLVPAFGILRKF